MTYFLLKLKNYQYRYNKTFSYVSTFLFLGLVVLSYDGLEQIKGPLGEGQEQKDAYGKINGTNITIHTNSSAHSFSFLPHGYRLLNVTFDSVLINNDHDLLFPAEWELDVYANNKTVSLLDGYYAQKVETGQTIMLKNKSISLPVSENDTLRIMTVGVEYDENTMNDLPNISGILDNGLSLTEYKSKSENSIAPFIAMDRNDAVGIVIMEFSADNDFGIGNHDDCSESSEDAGDLYDTVDTNCDFRLRYTVK